MESLFQLNRSRVGHDKLVRSAQYACKLLSTSRPGVASRAKTLEETLSSARKLLRLGTCVEVLHSSLSTVSHPDIVIRLTVTLSRIANAMFLFCDHLIWLTRVGIIRTDAAKWNELSNRCWLYSAILNLARDLHEVRRLVERRPDARKQPAVLVDLVKNSADLVLPLVALGYLRAPRLAGLLGLVSSLAATLPILHPTLRL